MLNHSLVSNDYGRSLANYMFLKSLLDILVIQSNYNIRRISLTLLFFATTFASLQTLPDPGNMQVPCLNNPPTLPIKETSRAKTIYEMKTRLLNFKIIIHPTIKLSNWGWIFAQFLPVVPHEVVLEV